MILDTNAVSAAVEKDRYLQRKLQRSGRPSIPVVVVGEFAFGLLGSNRGATLRASFEAILRSANVLAISEATAHHYAEVRHELKQAGTPIPANDLWIAALAREHQLPVVSRDSHFDKVSGIQRVDW